jgi:hypothetical protein
MEKVKPPTPETPSPGPDDLLPLDVAAKLAFPHIRMTASTLRTEHRKGRLAIYRVAGKDFTTLADIARMKTLCRIQEKAPGSGSSQQDETAAPGSSSNAACGASETDAPKNALASARARVTALRQSQAPKSKKPSPTTSRLSEKSRATATVIHLKS